MCLLLTATWGLASAAVVPLDEPVTLNPATKASCTPPLQVGPLNINPVCSPVEPPATDIPLFVDEAGDTMTGTLTLEADLVCGACVDPADVSFAFAAGLVKGGKAVDADLIDGLDSGAFLLAGAKAADADRLDGLDSAAFLRVDGKAADADRLDGLDSAQLLRSDQNSALRGDLAVSDAAGRTTTVSGGGIRFPDGTLQTTAGAGAAGVQVLYFTDSSNAQVTINTNTFQDVLGIDVASVDLRTGDIVRVTFTGDCVVSGFPGTFAKLRYTFNGAAVGPVFFIGDVASGGGATCASYVAVLKAGFGTGEIRPGITTVRPQASVSGSSPSILFGLRGGDYVLYVEVLRP